MTSDHDAHPDEGTIHAWLDRQLDAPAAAELEAHLQRCDECAERVAEARGLIAGASRVLAALDAGQPAITGTAPGGAAWPPVVAPGVAPIARSRGIRPFRVTPTRSAIAAVLVVAVGMAIVHEYERPSAPHPIVADRASSAPAVAIAPNATAPIAGAPVTASTMSALDSSAALQVAAARASAKAQQETTVTADRVRTDQAPASSAPASPAPATQVATAAEAAPAAPASGVAGGTSRVALRAAPTAAGIEAPQCYRVESATGVAAAWGAVPLPFVLVLDAPATRSSARVISANGEPSEVSATFERRANDSLVFTLHRVGYSGTLALGAPGEVRAGVMRSAPTTVALDGAEVAAAPKRAASQRRELGNRASAKTATDSAPAAAQRAASAEPAVPVVVRKVGCAG